MRSTLLIAVALLATFPTTVAAQGPAAAPYQRMRSGADAWHARGGGLGWHGGGYGGFYNPYFAPPPIIASSYYQRPYPYHLDYYRNRWAQPAPTTTPPPVEMIPTAADCPCLDAPQGPTLP